MNSILIGSWLFVSMLYQGKVIDPPNPDLKIEYTFYEDGTNLLHYHREGEQGSCDRLALYEYNGSEIHQQVTWVAPHNASFCSSDPDMQLERVTRTPASIKDGQFYLSLRVGQEDVIYIWDRKKN